MVFCTGSKRVLGGGAEIQPEFSGFALASSRPLGGNNGWQATWTGPGSETLTVWAICANVT